MVAARLAWLLCLVLAYTACLGQAQHEVLAGKQPWVTKECNTFFRAKDDEAMKEFYQENLEMDFLPWMSQKLTVADMYHLLDSLSKARPQKYLSLVLIKSNKVYVIPLSAHPMSLTSNRMNAIQEGLMASAATLNYEDTLYIMNVWDEPRCGSLSPVGPNAAESAAAAAAATTTKPAASPGGGPPTKHKGPACTIPIFSLIKRWDFESKRTVDLDVLLPFFNHIYENLIFYDWEKKVKKGLMRAAMQNGMHNNCTRMWLLKLQKDDPDGAKLLDAGITNNLKKGFNVKLSNYVTIADHSKYRYLISADGFTASARFGKLLGINSATLKEDSQWIEYYYRSAKPNYHYVPFNKDNVLEVLKTLEADPGIAQSVSIKGQHLAFTFLSQHNKAMYVRRAVQTYNGLFSDLKPFLASLGDNLEALRLPELMEAMKQYLDKQPKGG